MALAILELDAVQAEAVRFRIDTGSNRYYQLKLGRGLARRLEMDWVDDVYLTTPLSRNPAAGSLIDSRTQAVIPLAGVDKGKAYVQLFSFKSADGKSPSFSEVVAIGDSSRLPDPPTDFALPSSLTTAMTAMQIQPRVVPCRTALQALAQQKSLDATLGDVGKAAVPVVASLLDGAAQAPVASAAAPAAGDELLQFLSSLLRQFMGGAGGLSQSQSRSLSCWQSTARRRNRDGNRFAATQSTDLSHAFFAPALLAFLGPLLDGLVKVLPGVVGPVAQNAPSLVHEVNQAAPMLINALNQRQMQLKAANSKLATDSLAQLNQRMLAEEFLRARQSAPSTAALDPAALAQLLQLLQQASVPPTGVAPDPALPAGTPATAGTAAQVPAALASSLALVSSGDAAPSPRAMLTFSDGPTQPWNGSQRVLYARDRAIQLKLRFTVGPPVPSAPLPKAILKLVLKNGTDQSVLLEKTLKLKAVAANSELVIGLAAEEMTKLPTNRSLVAFAELRWLSGDPSRQSAAVGTTEFILIGACFTKQQGPAVSPEREPRDMNLYRSFWNKLWESPVIDEAGSRRERPSQVLWDLDVNAKYSVLLSADHDANGVMETRLLREATDPEDISARIQGRLRGGMELSIAALAQLLPLWEGAAPLAAEQLEALSVKPVETANASELIYHLKLNGRAGQRGIVWVLPVLRLFEFTLGRVRGTDDSGRVIDVTDETVRFPLPVAARLIGVRSAH